MKNTKKHTFAYPDPEKNKEVETKTTKSGKVIEKKADTLPRYIYRDLRRTAYIIGGFLVILAALYLIQTKTNWLEPVLKIFGI